ncbi:methyltransferase domain-containing protein [Candidatus Pacearchaeota archaeon]|nr:methyltransferase domain-containing protein [Candidatus Pacearchaeota archaeon]
MKKIINQISDKNRLRKFILFINIFKPKKITKILDVGASEMEYRESANILEKKYPYQENITVLGVDKYKDFCVRYPKVKVNTYGGDVFPFNNDEFDLVWSNAVIEHVGDKIKQETFIKEMTRVSKSVFFTTPNKFFPFELHTKILFLHFLPKRIFDKILNIFGMGWASGEYMHLLSLRDIKRLLKKCDIFDYQIIKNKLLGFVVDFVVIIKCKN